jgi:monoamine oxidase
MVAAYELMQAGHDLTILEAQRRPGGRVLTLREAFSDGLYAEAGAARIPDNHDITLRYVKHFGLTLDPFRPNKLSDVTVLRGKRLRAQPGMSLDLSDAPLDLTPDERRLGIAGIRKKYLDASLREIGDPSSPSWPLDHAKWYDSTTIPAFLQNRGVSSAAIKLLELPYSTPEDDTTSLLWSLREGWHESRETTRYKIRGGNDLLPKAFAAKLAEKIVYGSPAARIVRDRRKVCVTVMQTGGHQVFEAEYLICTIPFPALRSVEITPPFSEQKRKAIAELAYDSVTRVIFQARTRFWEADGCNGFGMTDLPQEIWHPTFDQPGPRGLLVSYMFGSTARRVGAMGEEERVEFVAREMEKAHPGLQNHLEGATTKVWDADPWARGAYCLPTRGQMTTLCATIRLPEDRVYFAGEHTSGWTGWMQGALESGLRVAKEVNEA